MEAQAINCARQSRLRRRELTAAQISERHTATYAGDESPSEIGTQMATTRLPRHWARKARSKACAGDTPSRLHA